MEGNSIATVAAAVNTADITRRDGRKLNELRGQEARLGELSAFDGSAWLSQGFTTVLATVTGPVAARAGQEQHDRAAVVVSVTRLAGVASGGGATRFLVDKKRTSQLEEDSEMASVLSRLFSHVILTESFPRCAVRIVVTLLQLDGSVLAAAVNAVMCALLDAAVPCRIGVASVSVGLTGSGDLLLDTNATEEQATAPASDAAEATVNPATLVNAHGTFAFALPQCGGGVAMAQVKAAAAGVHPALANKARLSPKAVALMEDGAARAADVVFGFIRRCSASAEAPLPRETDGIAV